MRPGAARRHHNAVEGLGFDHLPHIFQRVGGAGEGEMVGIDHRGQGAGILRQGLHIHDTGDVVAAMTHKDADPGRLQGDVALCGVGRGGNLVPPGAFQ